MRIFRDPWQWEKTLLRAQSIKTPWANTQAYERHPIHDGTVLSSDLCLTIFECTDADECAVTAVIHA
jgi:hypothetical protein